MRQYKKPQDIEEYKKWLFKNHDIQINDETRDRYYSVSKKVRNDFSESNFWKDIIDSYNLFEQQYNVKNKNYELFTSKEIPELKIKPYESFLLKTFRKNVVDNRLWPEAPINNWILPGNWYSHINDIIRMCFVVKYIDGVSFLADSIEEICNKWELDFRDFYEAKDTGYYAAHLYTKMEFEIPKEKIGTELIRIQIEMQITTQLQEVIRKLLRKHYEKKRKIEKKKQEKWQWDYESEEFEISYLGHILHYVEGMIMDVRNKQQTGE